MTTMKYAASGEQRKQLVNALSEVIGCESKYLKAPSYGYEVGSCIVNRTGDAKPAWLCSTFATRGKRFCNNKQIPEAILISKTKEVLGLCSLDGINLRDYISEIICHKEQNITFVLTDGDEITVAWSNSSRQNSWTEEMKQAARQKTLERSGL